MLRVFRRKAPGLLCKGLFLLCFLLVAIELTSSHPRIIGYPKDEAIEAPAKKEARSVPDQPGEKDDFKAVDVSVNGIRPQQKHLELQVASPAPGEAKVVRPSRENEFYENVLVHFDLKGAPPKVPYFLEMLRLISKAGATGILLEWEDMFPWEGKLNIARNTDAYSMKDVTTILDEAKKLGLDIIPLVQTFGHLEWFLKLEKFRKHRENEAYPQVLCLGDEEGIELVKDAVKQIVDVHKPYGIKYFHIGADEAFEFGVCQKSREWISKHGASGGKQLLALTHLKNMALYTKDLIGGDVTILAWHDMLKDFAPTLIKELNLGEVIEPVVWDYSEGIVTMNDWHFSTLAQNFPIIWASSAYKGANFPSAKYIDVRHYEKNNMQWVTVKNQQARKFKKFHGIIITGWQRYDHMAALCEILPMGTPSMIYNVKIALSAAGLDQAKARDDAAKALGCHGYQVAGLNLVSNHCTFPGFSVYSQFQGSAQQTIQMVEKEIGQNHHIMGWLSQYSIRHDMAQPWYLNQIIQFLSPLLRQLETAENGIKNAMKDLFFQNTIDEFIFLTMSPTTNKIRKMLQEAERLKQLRTFPSRHFPIKDEV